MNFRYLAVFAAVTLLAAGLVATDRPMHAEPTSVCTAPPAPSTPHPAPSAPVSTPGFRAAGLSINTPVSTGAAPADDGFGVELAFFGSSARTSLAIEYRHSAGGMLDIDSEASRLTRFTDDRGTDLRNEEAPFGPFETMARVSEDGRHLVFVVPSDALPSAGATRVSAAGVLAVRAATAKADFTSDVVELAAGAKVAVGGYDLRIEGCGPSQWGVGHALTLEARRDLAAIESWALVQDDGTQVPLRPSMSMSSMGTYQQTLELDEPVARARLCITSWTDLATIEVPFEVEAGLGLR